MTQTWLNGIKQEMTRTMVKVGNEYLKNKLLENGFYEGNETIYFKLEPAQLNQEFATACLVGNILEEAGVTFKMIEEPTDEEFVGLAELVTILYNDMMRGQKYQEFKETPERLKDLCASAKGRNGAFRHLVLLDEKEKMIGMSVVRHDLDAPKRANQFMTGLLAPYRGKGLAKWMKAYMYDLLFKQYESLEAIRTDCFAENLPILGLNKRFGFEEITRQTEMVFDR